MFKKLSFHDMQCLYNPSYLADVNQLKLFNVNQQKLFKENQLKLFKENSINYNKKFIENNKDKIKEKIECIICKGSYTYFNKSKHNKTKRHLKFIINK